MFVELVTTALLERALHERNTVAQFGGDLLDASRKGKFKLFTFGPGGVGKTVLGRLLSGEYTLETVPLDYDLSLETEKHAIAGRYFVACYVPPGQEEKRGYNWDELYHEIQTAKRYAIINVVCWGYHSLALMEFKRHRLYSPGMTEEQFLIAFLEEQRFAELRGLEELRYLRLFIALKRCTSHAGRHAGGDDARTARERGYKPRPQEPHSPHRSAVTGRRPFDERDSAANASEPVTDVNGNVTHGSRRRWVQSCGAKRAARLLTSP